MKSHRALFLLIIFILIIQTIPLAKAGYGDTQTTTVNKEVLKSFLRDNFKWRLQASPNNATWYNANELLTIGLVWVDTSNSYKVTLTLNTATAPQSLYYRFDLAFNKTILNYIVVNDWKVHLTVSEYPLYFDFSDIEQLVNTSKVWIDKGIKNNFFWFWVQSVNKIAVGTVFVVDPYYGLISPIKVSSYEFDTSYWKSEGYNSLLRLNDSNYYVACAKGTADGTFHGWLKVLQVSPTTGAISHSVISSYLYSSSASSTNNIIKIPNTDKYAISYNNGTSSKINIVTVQIWATNGTIRQHVIDKQALTNGGGSNFLFSFNNNVFIDAYSEGGSGDGFMETFWIDSNGMINNTLLDIQEFDTDYTDAPYIRSVDTNTVAITFCSATSVDFKIVTYNITTGGVITNTQADGWVYDTSCAYYSWIKKVGTYVYDITYVDSVLDIYSKTLTIADSGMITKAWIDSLMVMAGTKVQATFPFVVHDPLISANGSGILGTTIEGKDTTPERDGYMYTWEVNSSGAIGRVLTTYEFNTTQSWGYAPIVYVNRSWYLIITCDDAEDGKSETLVIYTNWATPTVSNIFPANYQTDVGLQPWCNVTLNDLNPDRMNLSWETLVGGSWITKQCNNSVKNGTYRYKYTGATSDGTGYSWRISVSDGYHNTSYVYYFTTKTSAEIKYGTPNPPSGTKEIPLIAGSWCIPINSSNGESFDWNITLMGYGSATGTGDSNGTKCLAYSLLLCGTNYTVWVNASNRFDSNSTKYWFWTINCTYCPDQIFNSTNISVWWYVDLWSDNGTFNYKIECNNSQNVSGIWVANGTYGIYLQNLSLTATYKIYVNLSTDNCWNNATYTLSFGGGVSASNLFINNDRFTLGLVLGSITFLFAGMVIWRRRKEG